MSKIQLFKNKYVIKGLVLAIVISLLAYIPILFGWKYVDFISLINFSSVLILNIFKVNNLCKDLACLQYMIFAFVMGLIINGIIGGFIGYLVSIKKKS